MQGEVIAISLELENRCYTRLLAQFRGLKLRDPKVRFFPLIYFLIKGYI